MKRRVSNQKEDISNEGTYWNTIIENTTTLHDLNVIAALKKSLDDRYNEIMYDSIISVVPLEIWKNVALACTSTVQVRIEYSIVKTYVSI